MGVTVELYNAIKAKIESMNQLASIQSAFSSGLLDLASGELWLSENIRRGNKYRR